VVAALADAWVQSAKNATASRAVQDTTSEPMLATQEVGLLGDAVWQAVEVLWGVNAAVKPSSVSIQTKLV
jgi:hypothetical protein